MEKPLVSVVVPVYNVEKYLNRCVESIVNQTYTNLEIILVDDGSPDNCPDMCDDWAEKDARIRVVHKENQGLGMARNTGIENANGNYIFFFDSDDYVDITIVEKCINAAIDNNSDAVIFGRYDVFDDGRTVARRITARDCIFDKNAVLNELLPAMFTYDMGFGVSAWGKMFNLNTIKKYQLKFASEKEIISEDAFFALEFFSKAESAVIIPENLYYYYKRNDSLSRAYKKERQIQNNIFLNKCLEYIKTMHLPEKAATHLKVRYHLLTIAAIKQIYASDLSRKVKHNEINKIFNDPVLCATLEREVLNKEGTFLKLFFSLVKIKCGFFCYVLLWIRSLKSS